MESVGWKMTSDTGAEWAFRRARGPRLGVLVEVGASFRRLWEEVGWMVGRRDEGATGESDFLVDHIPRVWSADAERILEEGWSTARESILPLWP